MRSVLIADQDCDHDHVETFPEPQLIDRTYSTTSRRRVYPAVELVLLAGESTTLSPLEHQQQRLSPLIFATLPSHLFSPSLARQFNNAFPDF